MTLDANVYVTRRIPDKGLDVLRQEIAGFEGLPAQMNPDDRVLARDELLEAIRGRDGVLCLLTDRIDGEAMDTAGPQCKVFANYAVGYNNVDVEAATQRKVAITNTPGVLTETTADLTWVLLMAVARRVAEGDRCARGGEWAGWGPMQFLGSDVYGRTLGIVGAGRIGQATARRSRGFGMKVLYCANSAKPELEQELGAERRSLEDLLAESDFVSIHVPLNDQTHHLIDAAALSRMKPTAYLINSARGPIVDEKALVVALRENQIAGAALDVYEDEPALAPGLAELDNTVLVPHIGSATRQTRGEMARIAATNLVAVLKGQTPPNCVNPEALD